MIWFRFALFVVKITVLLLVASWLVSDPGMAVLTWKGWEIETSLALLIVVLLICFAILTLIDRGWRGLRGVPDAVQFWLERRRERKGYEAAALGLIAAAIGDSSGSKKHAERSNKLLGASPLVLMLKAQTAQLLEQAEDAEACYHEMAQNDETRILGLRGLVESARRKGDVKTALSLAEQVIELHPKARWAHETSFSLHLAESDYQEAEKALRRAQRSHAYFVDDFGSKISSLLLMQAQAESQSVEHLKTGDAPSTSENAAAIQAAQERAASLSFRANSEEPSFVPAAVAAIRLHAKAGSMRKATKVAEQAWQKTQHPAIARAVADLVPDEHPLPRLKRIQQMCNQSKGVETDIVLARYALEARDFTLTEQALDRAIKERKTASLYLLRARLEEARGSEPAAAQLWRERARVAQELDPTWVCGACNAQFVDWSAICPNCSSFGQINWAVPRRFDQSVPQLESYQKDRIDTDSSANTSEAELLDEAIQPPSPDAPPIEASAETVSDLKAQASSASQQEKA